MGIYTAVHNFCTSQKAVGVGIGNSAGQGTAHRGGTSRTAPKLRPPYLWSPKYSTVT